MGLEQSATRALVERLPGRFLVLEGIDGVGKSTQHARLVTHLRSLGLDVVVTREPGGTSIGERIRELLLDLDHAAMSARCEVMLYMASRAQLIDEVIAPALANGSVVVSDRFAQSTIAYQGAGGQLPPRDIERIARIACGDIWPELVVIFDMDHHAAIARLPGEPDRVESKGADYRRRVRQAYLDLAEREPESHAVIDAHAPADVVFENLLGAIASWAQRQPTRTT